jgi:putative phage-type endonuclease
MKVVARTDKMSRDEWLELRRGGIGGSDAGTILGVNKYQSAYSLFLEKTGQLTVEDGSNEATAWGHALEPVIAERYAVEKNAAVVKIPAILQQEDRPWQLANLDYVIIDEPALAGTVSSDLHPLYSEDKISAILEIKTTGIATRGAAHHWDNNRIPVTYFWQGCHYAAVTGIREVRFAALIGGQGLVERKVVYSDEQVESLTLEEAAFWYNVSALEAPVDRISSSDLDVIKSFYPRHNEGVVLEADGHLQSLIETYQAAKRDLDIVEDLANSARAQLLEALGSAEGVSIEGDTVLT